MKKHKIKVILKVKGPRKDKARDTLTRLLNTATEHEFLIKTWGYPWEFKK
jgi:hypothetical protein